ncbi:MAG TPA: hypothetical protein VF147_15095 [Vicinamibacterales bacterium]
MTSPRFRFDRGARRPAADLLVRRPQHHDRHVRRPRALQRTNRGERDRDPGFHVERSWTRKPIAIPPERHALERANRPHGVEVPKDQYGFACAVEAGTEVIAVRGLLQAFNGRARLEQHAREHRTAAIDRGLIGARRLQPNQRLDRLNSLIETSFAEPQNFHATSWRDLQVARSDLQVARSDPSGRAFQRRQT